MAAQVLTPAVANLELTLLNAEAESWSSSDFYEWLDKAGLSKEVSMSLKNLIENTKEIAGRVISIGKIILMKILEFIKAHPNLAVGVAIGAAIGALVLLIPIPFVGGLLAPITIALGASLGAIAGNRIDKRENGQPVNTEVGFTALIQDAIEIAKAFFKLLIDIINAVFNEQVLG